METFDELFYREPFTREFDATVTSCEPADDDRFEVVLDDTAFYPEGGGQPGDRGTILPEGAVVPKSPEEGAAAGTDGDEQAESLPDPTVHVLDTQKHGDVIVHVTDKPLGPGTHVRGSLDWAQRRDNMEAHTGEHIVSGIVHGLYGYENVGFHMGERCIEVDFDGTLTEEQALDVERRANAAVREDVPVNVLLPSGGELAQMDYRSKKELEGAVRIVEIVGVDECACCGTHVSTTGQVGLIKVLRVSTKKKKTRLELLCGRRALEYVEAETSQLREVSNFLSVGDEESLEAVTRLSQERDDLKHEIKQLRHQAIGQQVASLAKEGGQKLLVRYEPAFDTDEARYFCEQATGQGAAETCAVLSDGTGKQAGRLNYVIASAEDGADLRQTCKELNKRLSGRGGGKPHMVQGSYAASREDTETALREVLA